MAISIRRLSDVLASTESGRLYRIEVFLQGDDPGRAVPPPVDTRYILRTTEGERVIPLDDKRYRLNSGEVLTALSPPRQET
ncbi:6-phosphofructokinase [Achromobacter deleyi]|uniref:6-phosphofructokinase n=1 Tax=Achromobacter deleyi TaxID=1353891 RepID=UPI001491210A|nr:6-phosphofructokinase [Achromobacter deleyi]QVQ29330.1 6-phosphofructokinase [Achromobacter deleyi]UIP19452.1 6-phosphofructokinase [Achromobacter deleyi]